MQYGAKRPDCTPVLSEVQAGRRPFPSPPPSTRREGRLLAGPPPPLPEMAMARLCCWPRWERRGKAERCWRRRTFNAIDPTGLQIAANNIGKLPSPGPANSPLPTNPTAGRGGGGEGYKPSPPPSTRREGRLLAGEGTHSRKMKRFTPGPRQLHSPVAGVLYFGDR